MKARVLFVCIHNSARSQMAEELLRKMAGSHFDVASAGIEPGKLNPSVVAVLKEEGIFIENKETQPVSKYLAESESFQYVITVCDETSAERCPAFPGKAKRIHWSFRDPSAFTGTPEEILQQTQVVKNEIRKKLKNWLRELGITE